VLRLADLLGLPPAPAETAVLVGDGAEQVAVAVEALGEQIEAPVRPMSGLLSSLPGVKGSLVDGDGRVLMVLDLAELVA
jgi:two-component system chemotaxis sensor kinase CheA